MKNEAVKYDGVGGWWFYNKDKTKIFGPFSDREEADRALDCKENCEEDNSNS